MRDSEPFVQFKNVKNTHGGVLPFTKSNTPLWVFFTFFILHKWYQVTQRTKLFFDRKSKQNCYKKVVFTLVIFRDLQGVNKHYV